jgi:adenosine deaminase
MSGNASSSPYLAAALLATGAALAAGIAWYAYKRSRKHSARRCASKASEDALLAFCRAAPKVELHAHLHGSIRDETLIELMRLRGDTEAEIGRYKFQKDRSLEECFRLFGLIHELVVDAGTVARIAREVLADFAADNVRYVELRTTPRAVESTGMSKRDYVKTVLREMRAAEARHGIRARLLISVNRSQGEAAAQDALRLAREFAAGDGPRVVGLDFSGNPASGAFADFAPVFSAARAAGLRTAVHVGEMPCACPPAPNPEAASRSAADTDAVLAFGPDRLGHAICLTPHQTQLLAAAARAWRAGRGARPPTIEVCPTSNVRTLRLSSYEQHPTVGRWVAERYPIALCTDDSGVFSTSLSEEWAHVARSLALSTAEAGALMVEAVSGTFQTEAERRAMARAFSLEVDALLRGTV